MEQPNYYAIIPATVRYDKNLSASQKIFYGEIVALSSKNGTCTASNNYFSNLYDVVPSSISNWIKKLEKQKYINVSYVYRENSKEIEQRIISIVGIQNTDEVFKKIQEGIQKKSQGYSKKVEDNNTSNNNTRINNNPIVPLNELGEPNTLEEQLTDEEIDEYNFELHWKDYPKKEGRTKAYQYYKQWINGRKINGKKITLTDEQIDDAVIKYAKKVKYTDEKYIQLGSTFFNTTILDYVDEA